LHGRKTEYFKAITSSCHASAIADHVTSTGHDLKWDHFDIVAKSWSDTHCKIKETLLIRKLKPTLNDTVSSEKLVYIFYNKLLFSTSVIVIINYLLILNLNLVVSFIHSLLKMYDETYETSSKRTLFSKAYIAMYITAVCVLFLIKLCLFFLLAKMANMV